MKIDVCSHGEASWLCGKTPKEIDVVLIVNSRRQYESSGAVEGILENARNCLLLEFDDIEYPRERFEMPTEESIRKAVDFARDKEQLIVSCTAGVSRSAATAYVILCSKMTPEEAIKYLDRHHHDPNVAIVKLGKGLLDMPVMEEVLYKWRLQQ